MNKKEEKPRTALIKKNENCMSTKRKDLKKDVNVSCTLRKDSKAFPVRESKSKESTGSQCTTEKMIDLSKPNLYSTLQLASEIQAASIENRPPQTLSQLKALQELNKVNVSLSL